LFTRLIQHAAWQVRRDTSSFFIRQLFSIQVLNLTSFSYFVFFIFFLLIIITAFIFFKLFGLFCFCVCLEFFNFLHFFCGWLCLYPFTKTHKLLKSWSSVSHADISFRYLYFNCYLSFHGLTWEHCRYWNTMFPIGAKSSVLINRF